VKLSIFQNSVNRAVKIISKIHHRYPNDVYPMTVRLTKRNCFSII
jgi:hypothetical protein